MMACGVVSLRTGHRWNMVLQVYYLKLNCYYINKEHDIINIEFGVLNLILYLVSEPVIYSRIGSQLFTSGLFQFGEWQPPIFKKCRLKLLV